jgi:hypothetical protein
VPATGHRPPAVPAAGTLRPARRRDSPGDLTAHSSLRLSSVKSAQRRTTRWAAWAAPSSPNCAPVRSCMNGAGRGAVPDPAGDHPMAPR